jgi:hypothetical protein
MLVTGLVVAGFSVPAILGALADGRAPRVASIAVLVGGGLVALAVSQTPGGYAIADIPTVFVEVVGRYID